MAGVSKEIAKKALVRFRREQKKRTIGTYIGCNCDSCVECMRLAISSVLSEIRQVVG